MKMHMMNRISSEMQTAWMEEVDLVELIYLCRLAIQLLNTIRMLAFNNLSLLCLR